MKTTDRLLSLFAGDFVEVVTNQKISVTKGDSDEIIENSSPYIVTGYLLDSDKTYIYLGDTPHAVTDVVKKRYVVQIGISRPADKYEDMLDAMDDHGGGN